jgi:hypothetical protein
MRITRHATSAGLLPGFVRFTAEVREANKADGPIWIDVPEAIAPEVVDRLDAWLLWVLPYAFETQQVLTLDGPVDHELLRNAHGLMEIWSRWRPDRRPVRIRAESDPVPPPHSERTGVFFSAGVDSFFTLFHHDAMGREHPEWRQRPIDDLVYVEGFDIPLEHRAALDAKRAALERIATETGKTPVTFATNLRETGVRRPWGPEMHGPALGGAGLLAGRRWGTMLLSAWNCHEDTDPWGSTGITDPLLSTSATRTRLYGAGNDRFEKIDFLSRFPLALDELHVCWEDRSERNCGRCEKCVRTLLAIEVLGVRERATTFPREPFDPGRLAEVWKDKPLNVQIYRHLMKHAERAERSDIVAAIARQLDRTPRSA